MAVLVVSYSHFDRPQVRAIVALLKHALKKVEDVVFWDGDFEPGELWFEQLRSHIDAGLDLYVFWCAHAADSRQVRREFDYALARNKRVVPVLLDDTPLVAELEGIHGLDLRDAVLHLPLGSIGGVLSRRATGLRPPHFGPMTAMDPISDDPRFAFGDSLSRPANIRHIRWSLPDVKTIVITTGMAGAAALGIAIDRFELMPLYANVLLGWLLVGMIVWSSRRWRSRPGWAGDIFISYRRQDSRKYAEHLRLLSRAVIDAPGADYDLIVRPPMMLLDRDRIVAEFARHLGED